MQLIKETPQKQGTPQVPDRPSPSKKLHLQKMFVNSHRVRTLCSSPTIQKTLLQPISLPNTFLMTLLMKLLRPANNIIFFSNVHFLKNSNKEDLNPTYAVWEFFPLLLQNYKMRQMRPNAVPIENCVDTSSQFVPTLQTPIQQATMDM